MSIEKAFCRQSENNFAFSLAFQKISEYILSLSSTEYLTIFDILGQSKCKKKKRMKNRKCGKDRKIEKEK